MSVLSSTHPALSENCHTHARTHAHIEECRGFASLYRTLLTHQNKRSRFSRRGGHNSDGQSSGAKAHRPKSVNEPSTQHSESVKHRRQCGVGRGEKREMTAWACLQPLCKHCWISSDLIWLHSDRLPADVSNADCQWGWSGSSCFLKN